MTWNIPFTCPKCQGGRKDHPSFQCAFKFVLCWERTNLDLKIKHRLFAMYKPLAARVQPNLVQKEDV